MNISIYTTSDFPFGGAAENLVRNLAFGLKINGCNVFIKLIRGHLNDKQNLSVVNNESIAIDHLIFKYRPKNELLKIVELFIFFFKIPLSLLRDKINYKIDYIILYGIEYFYLVFPIFFVSKLLNIKVIRFVTDFYHREFIVPVFWKSPKFLFYNLQLKFLDKYLDGLIYLSIYFKDFAKKYNYNFAKILFIPHLIDISDFTTIKEFSGFKDKIILGFIGTINEINGVYILLEAFTNVAKEYENLYLMLIGEVRVKNKKSFEQYLNHPRINYVGKINHQEIVNYIKKLDILINPRLSGVFSEAGFPTKVAEYLLSGRPTISSRTKNLEYYLKDHVHLIFTTPGSVNDLSCKIKKLINDESLCKRLASNGRKWATFNVCNKNNTMKLKSFLLTLE